jgi:DNA-binding GntR family transcriptional regulator
VFDARGYLANMSQMRWQQAVDEHERILVALEVRDSPGLSTLLKSHLQNKFATVRAWLLDSAGNVP